VQTTAAVLRTIGSGRPYAESRPLELSELELAPPGVGELLVRVEAAGVCHSDLSVVDGNRVRPVPMALGHEAAGEVIEVGPGVTDVAVGAHVVLVFVPSCGTCAECGSGTPALCLPAAAANGAGELRRGGRRLSDPSAAGSPVHHHLGVSAFSTLAVVDRGSAVVIGDDVPWATAALFGCALLTGVGAVHATAAVRPGESVGVWGLGGVGLAAVMGAVVSGASPVVAVDPVPAKRALALSLGATHAVDVDVDVRDLVPGGVRHAFEAVGRAATLATAFAATSRGGTTVSVGLPHPAAVLELPALQLVAEARTLVGSYMGSAVPQRDIPFLVGLWRAGRLPVERLLTGALPLGQVNEAMDALADGTAVRTVLLPQSA